jgi:hypothetical protein
MMGQLVTLPLRISARTASLMLRGTEAVVTRALALAGRPMTDEPQATPEPPPPPPSRPRPRREPPRQRQRQGEPAPHEPPAPPHEPPPPPAEPPPHAEPPPAAAETSSAEVETAPEPDPLIEEPTHVSEEVELVREEAEPGAEDGAGAEVRIDEPWEGYAKLNAKDVVARLAVASQAELAAVTLYESAHQARQSVLSAVERQLALAARGSTSN